MKDKKDVLFLLQYFYPEYVSSATLPFDTASKLSDDGFSVDVLCGYPHEYTEKKKIPRKETVNNINIRRVKYLQMNRKRALGRIINYLSLTISMFMSIFSMRKYKTLVVYSNPPILPIVATFANKIFGCKLIFVAYDLYPEIALKTGTIASGSVMDMVMSFINRVVYKQASAVVVLSSEMKEYVVKSRGIARDSVHIIPNWYKDEYQTENQENSFKPIVKERFVVGYFGNMGIAQDMEPIKGAMRYYKDDETVCFLLSGHGSKHSEIEEMICEEKISNAFLYGFLKGQEYRDALKISDCAVVSLQKGLTGLCVPSKTYGYMMQGLPIVAIMDDSDIVNDVREGAGYHIAENSTELFIDAIEKMKTRNEEFNMCGKISRKLYLEKYKTEICVEKYSELLKELLK